VKDNIVEAVSSTVSNPGPSWNKLGSAEKVFGKAMVEELKGELKPEPKDPTTRMVDELLGEEGESSWAA